MDAAEKEGPVLDNKYEITDEIFQKEFKYLEQYANKDILLGKDYNKFKLTALAERAIREKSSHTTMNQELLVCKSFCENYNYNFNHLCGFFVNPDGAFVSEDYALSCFIPFNVTTMLEFTNKKTIMFAKCLVFLESIENEVVTKTVVSPLLIHMLKELRGVTKSASCCIFDTTDFSYVVPFECDLITGEAFSTRDHYYSCYDGIHSSLKIRYKNVMDKHGEGFKQVFFDSTKKRLATVLKNLTYEHDNEYLKTHNDSILDEILTVLQTSDLDMFIDFLFSIQTLIKTAVTISQYECCKFLNKLSSSLSKLSVIINTDLKLNVLTSHIQTIRSKIITNPSEGFCNHVSDLVVKHIIQTSTEMVNDERTPLHDTLKIFLCCSLAESIKLGSKILDLFFCQHSETLSPFLKLLFQDDSLCSAKMLCDHLISECNKFSDNVFATFFTMLFTFKPRMKADANFLNIQLNTETITKKKFDDEIFKLVKNYHPGFWYMFSKNETKVKELLPRVIYKHFNKKDYVCVEPHDYTFYADFTLLKINDNSKCSYEDFNKNSPFKKNEMVCRAHRAVVSTLKKNHLGSTTEFEKDSLYKEYNMAKNRMTHKINN